MHLRFPTAAASAAILTSNQLFALLWAVTCVLYQYNVLRIASLKRRRAAEDFEDARTVAAAEDALNQLLDEDIGIPNTVAQHY